MKLILDLWINYSIRINYIRAKGVAVSMIILGSLA